MKHALALLLTAFLFGCTSYSASVSDEEKQALNQCAQQSFRCEQSCTAQNQSQSHSENLCIDRCIESHNQCKVAATGSLNKQ